MAATVLIHSGANGGAKIRNPAVLVFALGRFLLFIPTVWTVVTTSRRIQRGQRLVGASEVLNGSLAGLLWVFTLSIGGTIYTQMSMNKILRTLPSGTNSQPAPPAATPSPATRDADLERIGKLAALRDSGGLTEEEFAAQSPRSCRESHRLNYYFDRNGASREGAGRRGCSAAPWVPGAFRCR
jgi:hypothetical protein